MKLMITSTLMLGLAATVPIAAEANAGTASHLLAGDTIPFEPHAAPAQAVNIRGRTKSSLRRLKQAEAPVIVCPTDRQECFDGSFVTRSPPLCNFDPCPDAPIIVCTLDVKKCPDGTGVERSPPSCEYDPCPRNNDGA
ncbi:expressed unknown protein [Seminavis robusta]|uniref:Uncharacterized protein n=1 Tax=Seminavis robusta TaxID=568900 RepID=A0A9N8I108_9STRA|nr:expressed unknown protein [Seminavis robusta]|eukprot:Sro3022_g342270.1 n/a (138) ;mRNA; r:6846-7259